MQVKDMQSRLGAREVITVRSSDSVSLAAERMREEEVGCVIVLGRDRDIGGVLTERDIAFRVVASGLDPSDTQVSQVMTSPVTCCRSDSHLADVRRIMEERHVRHLPVLEGGRLAAVISLRDIVEVSANAERTACEMTIFSLAKLAESRDPETGSHLERVRELAAVLARSLSEQASFRGHIDEHFILLLRQTSALHDIGKVAVPDYVLLKPSRLTEGEYEIMKSHTVRGAETLDSVLQQFPATEFLKMARDIAAYHHERFDGTGYPDGLVGDQIPLAARVFALVDVYDALATKRVYKEAFSHELATNMILEAEETQFDPRIVSAFRHCQEAFRSIRDQQFSPDTSQHEGIAGHAMAAQV